MDSYFAVQLKQTTIQDIVSQFALSKENGDVISSISSTCFPIAIAYTSVHVAYISSTDTYKSIWESISADKELALFLKNESSTIEAIRHLSIQGKVAIDQVNFMISSQNTNGAYRSLCKVNDIVSKLGKLSKDLVLKSKNHLNASLSVSSSYVFAKGVAKVTIGATIGVVSAVALPPTIPAYVTLIGCAVTIGSGALDIYNAATWITAIENSVAMIDSLNVQSVMQYYIETLVQIEDSKVFDPKQVLSQHYVISAHLRAVIGSCDRLLQPK